MALFHPVQGPDDEGLPCIEIAGVLVFAYLDAVTRAVRVSVHLDTTDEQLLQADGAVPVQVDVEDATVFTHPPVPSTATGWKAHLGRLDRRATGPSGGKRRQGVDLQSYSLLLNIRGVPHDPVRHPRQRHRHR
ncbi:hypothetical protein AB0D47_36365 [Streptomyces sp. NPDC048376]|uniref:hypothetical protein n=1 Tax=Streptomyces sp. NPDC048376 TaxID=3154926 RepID=UPI003439CBF7